MVIMEIIFMFFLCYACHSIDDFVLQGCRCDLKQKSFWKKYNVKEYENDWASALISHSLEWSIVTSLPIIIYCIVTAVAPWQIAVVIVANAVIHFIVDTLKCNEFKINLNIDQSIHFLQVVALVATWAITCLTI